MECQSLKMLVEHNMRYVKGGATFQDFHNPPKPHGIWWVWWPGGLARPSCPAEERSRVSCLLWSAAVLPTHQSRAFGKGMPHHEGTWHREPLCTSCSFELSLQKPGPQAQGLAAYADSPGGAGGGQSLSVSHSVRGSARGPERKKEYHFM